MSLFQTTDAACPSCGKPVQFDLVASLNADRRPDLRAAILDGSFQRETCPHCGTAFRLEPSFNYIDQARGQWLRVEPGTSLARWGELEQQARALFDESFGAEAPALVREIGAELRPRLCFGWPALTEKLLCAEHGIDDRALELTKLALLRSGGEAPLSDGHELRLAAAGEAMLKLVWLEMPAERSLETLDVPREACEQIAAEPAWQPLRERLAAGFFVDMDRLLVPTPQEIEQAEAALAAAGEDAS
ncbi:CpXC domain-containing protein [Pelomonas sp. KK5]|uniref:CpXC domain-containing protein n=1 Tax=Pelomonas sp. KK5 TaxID=1855730 RepID=UPI00097BE91A|nr:CpXC domain-containing protein [Pelomonas sp. KK5]